MRLVATVCAAALLAGTATAQGPVPTPLATAVAPAPGAPPADAAAVPEPGFLTDGVTDLPAEPRDRYEKLNRGIWGFNQFVDRIVLKPASSGYRAVVPGVARRGISRVFSNLSEPWSFVNNLLQGKPGRALDNLGRFLINTTIGIGGLADPATGMGLRSRPEDFGQTLAVWGVKSSAYLVLPVLGPSTVRDGIGTGVSFVADPYQLAINQTDLSVWTKRGIAALSVLSIRADLTESGADAFLQSSLDPYAAARSAFLQRRAATIANEGDDDSGNETDATDSTAASPMTGITAPDATAVPDVPQAPTTPPPPVTEPAVPATDSTTPSVVAWNQPRLGAVVD